MTLLFVVYLLLSCLSINNGKLINVNRNYDYSLISATTDSNSESIQQRRHHKLRIFPVARKIRQTQVGSNIIFKYYKNGSLTFIGDGITNENPQTMGCNLNDKFAFVLHGWRESCDVAWMAPLLSKLNDYRGGCIVCIDYSRYANESYVKLMRYFDLLVSTITQKLKLYQYYGLNPENIFMFGFSYGGRLACHIGKKFGPGLIKEIDTCDMAGPGFDYKVGHTDNRNAAQNVQCIHTSRDKGTNIYNCHQNWRMGNCGHNQVAASTPPNGSHGLCPYIYTSAFDNNFYAEIQPKICLSDNPVLNWPINYKMGYMERRKSLVKGELFATTSKEYPFSINSSVLTTSPFLGIGVLVGVRNNGNFSERALLRSQKGIIL